MVVSALVRQAGTNCPEGPGPAVDVVRLLGSCLLTAKQSESVQGALFKVQILVPKLSGIP